MSTQRGFATLAALAMMILLVTYLSLNASGLAQNQLDLERSSSLAGQRAAWSLADDALKSLASYDPVKQRFSAWAEAHAIPGVTWTSLSARINLNTVTPFLLVLPGLQQALHGASVDQFVAFRTKLGPSTDLQAYAPLFDKDLLTSWFTVHSLWNINTADEATLEVIASERLQSPSAGSALRALVRSLREQKKRLTATQWQDRLGTNAALLGPVVTTDPELDVNELPEALLTTLLSNPDWAIERSAEKVQTLLSRRLTQPVDAPTLQQILGVPDDHIALAYLGTQTRFAQVAASVDEGTLTVVVRVSGTSEAPARILSTRWGRK